MEDNMERKYKVIALDFDGTLFETEYPTILRPIEGVLNWAIKRRKNGDKLILWTCREGKELEDAVYECKNWGLEFDAVNDNLPELKELWHNNPRKVAADIYIDDKNLTFSRHWHGNSYTWIEFFGPDGLFDVTEAEKLGAVSSDRY